MVLPIEFAVVFDKGCRVLWSKTVTKLKGDPVNALISKVLLEEKGQSQSAIIDSYSLSWRLINEADTLIVVVSQRSLELDFVGELLDSMRAACLAQVKKQDFHREVSTIF
jgi:signal recognition particle receptor subunit alpha